MTVDHDRMEDSVAAFVLDACDDDEAERVQAHIVGCPSCRALVRRLSQAVEALPLATDLERPPDRLRARILAAAAAAPIRMSDERPPPPHVLPLRPRAAPALRIRRLPVAWAAVGLLVAGLLGLAAWNVMLNRQLNAPPMRYALVGTGSLANASGTVTELARQDAAVVALTGMPPPAPGHVYELWLIDDAGVTMPAGVFTPSAQGTATLGIDRPLSSVRAVAVTQESGPEGAHAPTTKPELAGQIGR